MLCLAVVAWCYGGDGSKRENVALSSSSIQYSKLGAELASEESKLRKELALEVKNGGKAANNLRLASSKGTAEASKSADQKSKGAATASDSSSSSEVDDGLSAQLIDSHCECR